MEIEKHEVEARRELEIQKQKAELLEIWGRRRRLVSSSRFKVGPSRLSLSPRFGTSSMCPRAFEIVDEEVGEFDVDVEVHSSDGKFDSSNWWVARAWDQSKKVRIGVYCGSGGSVGSFGATLPYPSHHTAEVTTSDVQLFVAHVKGLGLHLVFTY